MEYIYWLLKLFYKVAEYIGYYLVCYFVLTHIFALLFWYGIRLCALRQNSVRDTLGSLIYLRLFDKTLRLLLQWVLIFNNYKLLRIHWFVGLGAS